MQSKYVFTATDGAAVLSALVSGYEKITGRTLLPADPERIFISWVAAIITEERVLQNYIGNQNIPSRSSGADLDALGELIYSFKRPGATPARCTMRFILSEAQNTSVLIPKGTRVSGSGTAVFETVEDKYVEIGDISAEVEAVALEAGYIGNDLLPGQINILIDVDNVLYYTACENLNTSYGGADEATDEEYYSLMRSSLDAYSVAGPEGAYIHLAKSVSTDISDVKALNDGAGCVAIYAIMSDGSSVSDEIKDAIHTACSASNKRPLTDLVTVKDPEAVEYEIDMKYFLPENADSSASDLENAVNIAIEEYVSWQGAKMGRDINPSELIYRVKKAGIKRVEVTKPIFTKLNDGKDGTVPQCARIRSRNIVNGGQEDE